MFFSLEKVVVLGVICYVLFASIANTSEETTECVRTRCENHGDKKQCICRVWCVGERLAGNGNVCEYEYTVVFCFHDALLERLTVPAKRNAKVLERCLCGWTRTLVDIDT